LSKKEKLLNRFLTIPKDFEYKELTQLLNSLGYVENNKGKSSGSRVAFMDKENGQTIFLHKPHPTSILKKYQLDSIKVVLKQEKKI
jgi:hypothetical protein